MPPEEEKQLKKISPASRFPRPRFWQIIPQRLLIIREGHFALILGDAALCSQLLHTPTNM